MTGYLRDFLKDAEKLGFTFDGYDGRGHIRLINHATGVHYPMAATPSDWRSRRNAISDLERLSGRKLARPNAGKHRHVKVTPLDPHMSATEMSVCAEIRTLLGQAETLRKRFAALTDNPCRDHVSEARKTLARYEELRTQLQHRHRIIGPITAAEP